MMKSLFSGVAGLKTHQSRMDVIGNNISNVNTVGFKSSSMRFQDLLYQTTQSATGPSNSGRAGTNARQIGLGAQTAAIQTNITQAGSPESTGMAFDMYLQGDSFFMVSPNGSDNVFYTRAGAFAVDAQGTLCMSSNGYPVMGYGTTTDTNGKTVVDSSKLTTLPIQNVDNSTSAPAATRNAFMTGIVDKNDPDFAAGGKLVSFAFYDNVGYKYTATYKIEGTAKTEHDYTKASKYTANTTYYVADNTAAEGFSEATPQPTSKDDFDNAVANGTTYYTQGKETIVYSSPYTMTLDNVKDSTGKAVSSFTPDPEKVVITFGKDGTLSGDGASATDGTNDVDLSSGLSFSFTSPVSQGSQSVTVDFSGLKQFANNGRCAITSNSGTSAQDSTGCGWATGSLKGFNIGTDGTIYGTYDNGQTILLGQIPTATFSNAAGLSKEGENLYAETLNSGTRTIGDPTAGGGALYTGQLEMSNVDLAQEFTTMITTQRGFQANSRIITVSDTMLEELTNLKR